MGVWLSNKNTLHFCFPKRRECIGFNWRWFSDDERCHRTTGSEGRIDTKHDIPTSSILGSRGMKYSYISMIFCDCSAYTDRSN